MKNLLIAGLALAAVAAYGEPFRLVFTNQGGAKSYTAHAKPLTVSKVYAHKGSAATSLVTITHIHDGLTNAFAAITLASAAGTASNLTAYVFPQDTLYFSYLGGATQAVFKIEGTTP